MGILQGRVIGSIEGDTRSTMARIHIIWGCRPYTKEILEELVLHHDHFGNKNLIHH